MTWRVKGRHVRCYWAERLGFAGCAAAQGGRGQWTYYDSYIFCRRHNVACPGPCHWLLVFGAVETATAFHDSQLSGLKQL